jgi:hypothetical protein
VNCPLTAIRKKGFRPKLSIAAFAFVAIIVGGSGSRDVLAVSNGFPAPWQQEAVSIPMIPGHTNPKIDHGYILFARWIIVDGVQNGALYLKSLADRTEYLPSFWINGASIIWINDLAVTSDRKLLVVGSFSRSTDHAPVNFLAESELSGRTLETVDTGTYEPELACVTADGSIWTFGQDWSAERSDIPYPLMRNYSSTGQLLGSYLSSDSIPPARLNFSTRLHRFGGAPGRIFLQCGDQTVGAYVETTRTWAEIDLAPKTLHIWQVRHPASGHITGLALLGRHELYASFKGRDTVFVRGFFKLDLGQPKAGEWEPIQGMVEYFGIAQKPSQVISVIGADSSSLVYQRLESDKHVFCWVKP